MPPKSSKSTKAAAVPSPKVETIDDFETGDVEDVGDTDASDQEEIAPPVVKARRNDLPALEEELKERYEYKPVVTSRTVYVKPEDRITSEIMTKFEYCEVVSIRAKQIEDGNQPFIPLNDMQDPLMIARMEIAKKKCPLSIVRHRTVLDDGTTIAELWQVNEMGIPHD